MDWQPIETAPTDISGYFYQPVLIGFAPVSKDGRKMHVGPIVWSDDLGFWEFTEIDYDVFPRPTHWMPLPAPPSPSPREGS